MRTPSAVWMLADVSELVEVEMSDTAGAWASTRMPSDVAVACSPAPSVPVTDTNTTWPSAMPKPAAAADVARPTEVMGSTSQTPWAVPMHQAYSAMAPARSSKPLQAAAMRSPCVVQSTSCSCAGVSVSASPTATWPGRSTTTPAVGARESTKQPSE